MRIYESFYAPLWKLLIGRKMSQADFRRVVQLSHNTLTKMKSGNEVSAIHSSMYCNLFQLQIWAMLRLRKRA